MCVFMINRVSRQQSSQGEYKIPHAMMEIRIEDRGGIACVRMKQTPHTSDIEITKHAVIGCIKLKMSGDAGRCRNLLNNTENSLVTKADVTLINDILNSLNVESIIEKHVPGTL
ncbi:hypothetical protein DL89DRAFT_271269 [Linderina pennispora]|uniref:Uncharacterized protein n=1 Tax=Linderina pennispora TaxID=61395 RepID=A0A1Y1VV83_9FUNG|nr:uncharacterized protein DL89DRAFT_271269 [Linderina pennispora]ORX65190.1 hypothetical protein DL89DRAFT_271269 [Linderina pennispora]